MKKLGKLLRNMLLVCGVLFIIVLLLPDDEEMSANQEQTGVETASGIGTQTGTETASGAETLEGAEHVASAAENPFPEDMVKEKQTEIKGDGKDQATVFVYMNGSDLESEDGEATEDLCEMLAANISSQVNVLVETIGTKSWSKRLGIASDHTQRYKAEAGNLVLVDDSLGQLDCTSPDTLADFISWGAENYPANRYILIFWDHGAGPVYGFGYDEHQSEDSVLTIDEIQTAIHQSGIYFDIIGMDSCIMSSLELCCAMYNYCDYMILSEDFESGYGWSYTGWLNALSENTSISSEKLGKIIVDDMIAQSSDPVQEKHGSPMQAQDHAKITVLISADGVDIEEEQQVQYWNQKYLIFDFPVTLKSDWKKSTVLFKGVLSINDVPASKISFLVKCQDNKVQKPEMKRRDMHSAFVSYSRKDISQVAFVMMGIRKARPDLEMFFDVESMHSGEDWEKRIKREIDEKDILFLCWSVHASKSVWVDREWRYAYAKKGADGIDPIPLESAQKCPPPKELEKKHFNENLLFVVESNRESRAFGKSGQITVLECKTMELHRWSQQNIIIGRENQERCNLSLDSRNVSRQHLLLEAKDRDGMYTVRDLGSTGHTYLVSEKREQILEPEWEYKVPVGTVLRLANRYIIVL